MQSWVWPLGIGAGTLAFELHNSALPKFLDFILGVVELTSL